MMQPPHDGGGMTPQQMQMMQCLMPMVQMMQNGAAASSPSDPGADGAAGMVGVRAHERKRKQPGEPHETKFERMMANGAAGMQRQKQKHLCNLIMGNEKFSNAAMVALRACGAPVDEQCAAKKSRERPGMVAHPPVMLQPQRRSGGGPMWRTGVPALPAPPEMQALPWYAGPQFGGTRDASQADDDSDEEYAPSAAGSARTGSSPGARTPNGAPTPGRAAPRARTPASVGGAATVAAQEPQGEPDLFLEIFTEKELAEKLPRNSLCAWKNIGVPMLMKMLEAVDPSAFHSAQIETMKDSQSQALPPKNKLLEVLERVLNINPDRPVWKHDTLRDLLEKMHCFYMHCGCRGGDFLLAKLSWGAEQGDGPYHRIWDPVGHVAIVTKPITGERFQIEKKDVSSEASFKQLDITFPHSELRATLVHKGIRDFSVPLSEKFKPAPVYEGATEGVVYGGPPAPDRRPASREGAPTESSGSGDASALRPPTGNPPADAAELQKALKQVETLQKQLGEQKERSSSSAAADGEEEKPDDDEEEEKKEEEEEEVLEDGTQTVLE